MTYVVTTSDTTVQRCHKAGCGDIAKRGEWVIGKGDTIAEAVADGYSEYLAEGSMTLKDCLRDVKTLTCAR